MTAALNYIKPNSGFEHRDFSAIIEAMHQFKHCTAEKAARLLRASDGETVVVVQTHTQINYKHAQQSERAEERPLQRMESIILQRRTQRRADVG